ncbi:MAG: hypothetical protein AUH85_13845 [Chloroflexi bacterium 13_1_40CM_4_68_4]|nr:MAG: hypothetical protein AUH85_13845 [Chloroflexi bacterium 13_1_40CM_4_68_4]
MHGLWRRFPAMRDGLRSSRSRADTAEIAKCDIVCANCHRARTHARFLAGDFQIPHPPLKERTPRRDRMLRYVLDKREEQSALIRAFRSTPCFDCHQHFPWFVMEFDHRDPARKRNNVPFLAGRIGLVRLLEEIEKCDIVCANCHRVRSYSRRDAARTHAGVA